MDKDYNSTDYRKGQGKHAAADYCKSSSDGGFLRSFLIDLVIAMLLASVFLYFFRPTVVKQSSMEDTLHNNDYMILARRAYKDHTPERGDIIVFHSELTDENGKDKLLIKRVIGLPGDEISIVDQQLFINGEAYVEDYLKDGFTPAGDTFIEDQIYTVPDGCYFALGDNRAHSTDSRDSSVGCVPFEQIQGKIILRLFPFNKINRF